METMVLIQNNNMQLEKTGLNPSYMLYDSQSVTIVITHKLLET